MADGPTPDQVARDPGLRRTVARVAALNLGYFGVEVTVALLIGSVALFADSVDFLEDAAVNLLVLLALGWSARRRALVGAGMALLLVAPSLATLWTAWAKLLDPVPPAALPLTAAGLGALAVNGLCAWWLAPWRRAAGSLTRAAFLSARNDAIANLAIIAAGLLTTQWVSAWPDLVVGVGILLLNLGAAGEILAAARAEHRGAPRA
jgi:Co/Zn/Cd efflux system component